MPARGQTKVRLEPKLKNRIVAKRRAGWLWKDIAVWVGVSRQTLDNYRAKLDIRVTEHIR